MSTVEQAVRKLHTPADDSRAWYPDLHWVQCRSGYDMADWPCSAARLVYTDDEINLRVSVHRIAYDLRVATEEAAWAEARVTDPRWELEKQVADLFDGTPAPSEVSS